MDFSFGGDQRESLFLNRKISQWIFYADSVLCSFATRRGRRELVRVQEKVT